MAPIAMLAYLTALTALLDVPALRFRLPFEPIAIMLAVPAFGWAGQRWVLRRLEVPYWGPLQKHRRVPIAGAKGTRRGRGIELL
jgi:hypothetical protein